MELPFSGAVGYVTQECSPRYVHPVTVTRSFGVAFRSSAGPPSESDSDLEHPEQSAPADRLGLMVGVGEGSSFDIQPPKQPLPPGRVIHVARP
jgi:hypothetical protein